MTRLGILLVLACSVTGCNESRRPTGDVMGRGNPVNDRKNESGVKTLLDQNENQTDIDITANIRKRVVDSLLSVNARNVKIITQDGSVTLQGTVDTPEEKKRIEDIAKDVAGANEVTSLLKIEPKP